MINHLKITVIFVLHASEFTILWPSCTFFCYLQASENLGMAMVYTLVTSAKEWLSERFVQQDGVEKFEDEEAAKDEVCFHFPASEFSVLKLSLYILI